MNGDRYRELKDAVLFPTTMVNSEAAREGREKEQRYNYIAGSYSFVLTLVIAVKLFTSFQGSISFLGEKGTPGQEKQYQERVCQGPT